VAVIILDRLALVFATKPRATRKVVDTNFLQDEALRLYLSASVDNYAVLTDYAAMEAYKGDTLTWIYDRMDILAQYPKQVLVLKGMPPLIGGRRRPIGSHVQHRHLSCKQGRSFQQLSLLGFAPISPDR
jgi:hypothetical protein